MKDDGPEHAKKTSDILSFIVLAGGKAKRFKGHPKLLNFMYGKNLLLNIVNNIHDAGMKPCIKFVIRKPWGDSIDNMLKQYRMYDDYNVNRVFYHEEADSKAFAIWEVTTQVIHTPLVAVLQGDVVYGSDLFTDFSKKLNEFYDKKLKDYAGFIYLAKSEPPSPAPVFKTKHDAINNITCLEEICKDKKDSSLHPAISVFDAEKLKALRDVPRYESNTERAGTTYICNKFIENNYKFCVVESDFTIADLNTPAAYEIVQARFAPKNA